MIQNLVGCDAGRWGDKCEKRCQERAQFIVLISEIYPFRIFFQLIFIEGVFRKRCQRKAIIIYVEICK